LPGRRTPVVLPGGGAPVNRDWNADELAEYWTLLPDEKRLLANKSGVTRLGVAVLLKLFQHEGRFPRQRQDVPGVAIEYVARQADVAPGEWAHYDWDRRTIKYHRAQIRAFLGFREATVEDGEALVAWLAAHVPPHKHMQTVIRNSYRSYFRRMVPRLLNALDFRSNNKTHRPVLRALALVRKYADSKLHTYPPEEVVPLEGVVRGPWQDAVLDRDEDGNARVNRISYEICVLQALREQLRCKEVWVRGADRYRNPDEDLPVDFDTQQAAYYAALQLPQDADAFVAKLRQDMTDALTDLDRTLKQNPHLQILPKAGGWIALSKLETQPEPENLLALKAALAARWPMTSLLDMLKETALRVGFSDAFHSGTTFERMDRASPSPKEG
jgi:hypothetical protein